MRRMKREISEGLSIFLCTFFIWRFIQLHRRPFGSTPKSTMKTHLKLWWFRTSSISEISFRCGGFCRQNSQATGKKIQISPLFLYFLPRIFLTVWSNCCGRIQANLHRAFKYNSSQLHHLRRDSFSWQFYPSEIKDKLCTIIPLWLCTYFPFILCIGIAGPFSVFSPPSIFVLSSVYIWLWRKQFSQQLLYKQSKINIYSVTQIGQTKEEQKKISQRTHTNIDNRLNWHREKRRRRKNSIERIVQSTSTEIHLNPCSK